MEHRCTERIESKLRVLIYKHNFPVAIGCINNGSAQGVFVETDFVDIECEHQLKLEVIINKKSSRLQAVTMEAIVIHKTEKGFGAEIDFFDELQANEFLGLLQGNQAHLVVEPVLALVI